MVYDGISGVWNRYRITEITLNFIIMPENENAVAQEFETPRLSKWLIVLAIISIVSSSCCSSCAEDSFPLI